MVTALVLLATVLDKVFSLSKLVVIAEVTVVGRPASTKEAATTVRPSTVRAICDWLSVTLNTVFTTVLSSVTAVVKFVIADAVVMLVELALKLVAKDCTPDPDDEDTVSIARPR